MGESSNTKIYLQRLEVLRAVPMTKGQYLESLGGDEDTAGYLVKYSDSAAGSHWIPSSTFESTMFDLPVKHEDDLPEFLIRMYAEARDLELRTEQLGVFLNTPNDTVSTKQIRYLTVQHSTMKALLSILLLRIADIQESLGK